MTQDFRARVYGITRTFTTTAAVDQVNGGGMGFLYVWPDTVKLD